MRNPLKMIAMEIVALWRWHRPLRRSVGYRPGTDQIHPANRRRLPMAGLATFSMVMIASSAAPAAQDDFGRYWYGTISWSSSPALDQRAGLQFAQVRDGLPGIWLDGRFGQEWDSGYGGICLPLLGGMAGRVGAGFASGPDGTAFGLSGGLTATWRRLVVHVDYDSEPRTMAGGIGLAFWR